MKAIWPPTRVLPGKYRQEGAGGDRNGDQINASCDRANHSKDKQLNYKII